MMIYGFRSLQVLCHRTAKTLYAREYSAGRISKHRTGSPSLRLGAAKLTNRLQSWKTLAALALIAIVGGFGLWWWHSAGYVSTDDARIKADIVAVSAELTARLNSLTKQEGDAVAQHEVLATLDRRELEIQLRQAEAEVDRLRSKARQGAKEIELHVIRQKEEVAKAEAALRASRHQLEDARAHAVQVKDDWSRNQRLFERALVAEQELDRAKTSLRQADARMSALQEKIKEGESMLDLARFEEERLIKEYNVV